jgi:hypothetical protein
MSNKFEELHSLVDLVSTGALGRWADFKHACVSSERTNIHTAMA